MSLLHLLAPFTAFSRGKKFSDQAKGVCDNEISIDLHKTRDPPSDSIARVLFHFFNIIFYSLFFLAVFRAL